MVLAAAVFPPAATPRPPSTTRPPPACSLASGCRPRPQPQGCATPSSARSEHVRHVRSHTRHRMALWPAGLAPGLRVAAAVCDPAPALRRTVRRAAGHLGRLAAAHPPAGCRTRPTHRPLGGPALCPPPAPELGGRLAGLGSDGREI